MKDFAGNELKVGDKVVYLESGRNTTHLEWGTIDRFTPQMVVFEVERSYGTRTRRCPPDRIVKPFKE